MGEGGGGRDVRTLISHQCGPEVRFLDTDSADSVLAPRDVSLGAMVFPPPQKPRFSTSNSV